MLLSQNPAKFGYRPTQRTTTGNFHFEAEPNGQCIFSGTYSAGMPGFLETLALSVAKNCTEIKCTYFEGFERTWSRQGCLRGYLFPR